MIWPTIGRYPKAQRRLFNVPYQQPRNRFGDTRFATALSKKIAGGSDRRKAILALAQKYPADHAAYVISLQQQELPDRKTIKANAAEYDRLVKVELKAMAGALKTGSKTRADAFATVTAQHPELHQCWLEVTNRRGRK